MAVLITNSLPRSNTPSNQKRNLKPTVLTQGAYSASPSQLPLSSDPSTVGIGAFHNPYQSYNPYGSSQHTPTAYSFSQQHTQYPHQLQTQHQPISQQHQQQTQQSPLHTRKRRASELGSDTLPGSSHSNVSAFSHPQGLTTSTSDVDLGLGPSQAQISSPVAKKGRTNTPWTPAEEQRLKQLREAGSSWSEIAKTFPARTEGSVKKHWYKVRPPFGLRVFQLASDVTVNDFDRTCTMRSLRKTRSAISFASPWP